MENPYTINENSEKRWLKGKLNKTFVLYDYFQEGLNNISNLKTIAYFLIGIGLIFQVDSSNYILLGLVGLIAAPFILLLGYIMATRGNMTRDYNRVKNLSTFGKYGIEMQERNIKQQDEIITELKKLNENFINRI